MSASEKYSLKFFEAVIHAAKGLSQDEIEQIENGQAKIEILVNEISKKAKKKQRSENDLNQIFEEVKEHDPVQRQGQDHRRRDPFHSAAPQVEAGRRRSAMKGVLNRRKQR